MLCVESSWVGGLVKLANLGRENVRLSKNADRVQERKFMIPKSSSKLPPNYPQNIRFSLSVISFHCS